MTYVKINGTEYEATVSGKITDKDWNNRESKAITLSMTYADAITLFVDDVTWYIVERAEDTEEEYDNSAFSVAGDITDHRNGTLTVKMGKQTDLEDAYELLYG